MGGGSAFEVIARAYRPTAPLTLPSPHEGERASNNDARGLYPLFVRLQHREKLLAIAFEFGFADAGEAGHVLKG